MGTHGSEDSTSAVTIKTRPEQEDKQFKSNHVDLDLTAAGPRSRNVHLRGNSLRAMRLEHRLH